MRATPDVARAMPTTTTTTQGPPPPPPSTTHHPPPTMAVTHHPPPTQRTTTHHTPHTTVAHTPPPPPGATTPHTTPTTTHCCGLRTDTQRHRWWSTWITATTTSPMQRQLQCSSTWRPLLCLKLHCTCTCCVFCCAQPTVTSCLCR